MTLMNDTTARLISFSWWLFYFLLFGPFLLGKDGESKFHWYVGFHLLTLLFLSFLSVGYLGGRIMQKQRVSVVTVFCLLTWLYSLKAILIGPTFWVY